MSELIKLVNGSCPFNPNHKLEEYKDDYTHQNDLVYCIKCDIIFQK